MFDYTQWDGIVFDLRDGFADFGKWGVEKLLNFENLIGSRGDDVLVSSGGNDVLGGGSGHDRFVILPGDNEPPPGGVD